MSFFAEPKRSNVVRLAATYVVAVWPVIQVVENQFIEPGRKDLPIMPKYEFLLALAKLEK
jgi:hypothetical protein